MSVTMTPTRARLERLLDERVMIQRKHEDLLAAAEGRDDKGLTEFEGEQLKGYQERQQEIDTEIASLADALEREDKIAEESKRLRPHLHSRSGTTSIEGGETVYRSFYEWARDVILVKHRDLLPADVRNTPYLIDGARERLQRAPAHTTTSDIGGLLPPQHISQIMDVIDASRPVIASARVRMPLQNGRLSWPDITQKPQVLFQATEKTEGGTLDMQVSMVEGTAETFIGGGNLSWQAINWSSPSALDLWFRLAGEQYARKTESTACAVLVAAGTAGIGGNALAGGTADTFAAVIAAVAAGASEVYGNSGAMVNTLWLSPDLFFTYAGITTDAGAPFVQAGQLNISALGGSLGGINVVASHGFGTGVAVIGDANAFMVGETPGSPVELRAVEPAIGGLEVGVIGAFKAVAFDPLRFADLKGTA